MSLLRSEILFGGCGYKHFAPLERKPLRRHGAGLPPSSAGCASLLWSESRFADTALVCLLVKRGMCLAPLERKPLRRYGAGLPPRQARDVPRSFGAKAASQIRRWSASSSSAGCASLLWSESRFADTALVCLLVKRGMCLAPLERKPLRRYGAGLPPRQARDVPRSFGAKAASQIRRWSASSSSAGCASLLWSESRFADTALVCLLVK